MRASLENKTSPEIAEELKNVSYFRIDLMAKEVHSSLWAWCLQRTLFPNSEVMSNENAKIDSLSAIKVLVKTEKEGGNI